MNAGRERSRGLSFSVKLPRTITHDQRFVDCTALLERFVEEVALLGDPVVVEPRHPSWFEPLVDALLAVQRIARVAADPAVVPLAGEPGGWPGFAFFRLHGAPRIYRSPYEQVAIPAQAERVGALADAQVEVWTIYENTASGAALDNAALLQDKVQARYTRPLR